MAFGRSLCIHSGWLYEIGLVNLVSKHVRAHVYSQAWATARPPRFVIVPTLTHARSVYPRPGPAFARRELAVPAIMWFNQCPRHWLVLLDRSLGTPVWSSMMAFEGVLGL